MRTRPIVVALSLAVLFVAAASLLWLPFDNYTVLYGTRPGGAVPAGEIRAGFELAQQVRPPPADNVASDGPQNCFAIRFATYARHNSGHLQVRWRQGTLSQDWRVDVSDLADNTYRHFCPDLAFSANRPFHVEVIGLDSAPGESSTLWLVADDRFGIAQLPHDYPQRKSMALQGSTRAHIDAAKMLQIDRGAYFIGWLCTLAIGILALIWGFGARRHPDDAK